MLPRYSKHSLIMMRTSILLCGILPCGCSRPSEPSEDAGPGGRRQPLALSPADELKVGRKAYEQVMTEVGMRADHPTLCLRCTNVVEAA